MAIVAPRTNGVVQIDSGATTEYGGVTAVDVSLNTSTSADDSGSVYDDARSIVDQRPTISFTMKDWVRLLNYIGVAGKCLTAPDYLNVFEELHAQCTPRAAGASHTQYQIANGLLVPQTLNAEVGQDATMSFMAHGISVSGAAPMASSYTVSLPTPVITEQHTLGVVQLNVTGTNSVGGTETVDIIMENITGITVDFGIEVRKRGGPGTVWPLWVSVAKIRPTVRIRSVDLSIWDDVSPIKIPMLGGMSNHTTSTTPGAANTMIQFIKKKSGSTFFPASSAVHFGLSIGGMCYITQAASASAQGDGELELVIEGMWDGTYAPVTRYANRIYENAGSI